MLSPQTQGGSDLTHTEGALRSTECGRQGGKDGWSAEGIPPHMHSPDRERCRSEGLQGFNWTCLVSD